MSMYVILDSPKVRIISGAMSASTCRSSGCSMAMNTILTMCTILLPSMVAGTEKITMRISG